MLYSWKTAAKVGGMKNAKILRNEKYQSLLHAILDVLCGWSITHNTVSEKLLYG